MASSGPAYDRFLAKQDNLHSSVGTSLSATLTKNFGRFCKLYSSSGEEMASIPVGPKPRFLTASGGSVWTLNQGDGSVSRVDEKSRKVIATIPVGIPGAGGELAYGADALWATVFDLPLSRIDPHEQSVSPMGRSRR